MFKIGLLTAVILTLAAGFVLLRVYRQRMEVPTGAAISFVLDFFCMLVGIVLYVSSKQYLKTDIKSTAVLMNMVFATICAQFLAVFIWVFEGPEGSPLLNYTVNLIYFCVAEVVLMCYLRYQWEILGRQAFGSQWLYRASVWFGVAILAIYALNPLGGVIFFIDADGFYRRGAYYWVSLVYPAYVFLLSVYLALRCNQPRSVRMNLLFYWAAPLIGAVTQTVRIVVLLVYPGVLLSEIILIGNLHAEVMQRYLRQRAELTDNQSKIMLSQIQPHFLYNALASISHLCRKEGAWEAKDAVDHFSDYLRSNMESIRQAWSVKAGVSDGTNPTGNITREQLAAMLYRYAKLKGYDVSAGEDTNILSYDDAFSVSEYAVGAGIINGDNNNLKPTTGATRAEVATMLMRFCETVVK